MVSKYNQMTGIDDDVKKILEKEEFEPKDLLNEQESKLMHNLKNRKELMKSDIISPEMRESVTGGIDPDKHPTLYNDAVDHITSGDCRHCIKLVARHERNDTEFPLDGNIVNQYNEQAVIMLNHAQVVFEEAQEERAKAEKLNEKTTKMLDEPIAYMKKEIMDEVKKYAKIGALGGTPVVIVIVAVLSYIIPVIGNLFA